MSWFIEFGLKIFASHRGNKQLHYFHFLARKRQALQAASKRCQFPSSEMFSAKSQQSTDIVLSFQGEMNASYHLYRLLCFHEEQTSALWLFLK